jgi:ubiquinol-cytochrome c reductase cytochrome b/c1 subunit
MSGHSTYQPKSAGAKWLEERLPILSLMHSSFVVFPNPRNLNYWWTFGGILAFFLVVQILSGLILAMHYTPHVGFAFESVEHIMRNVNYGWLLRYVHSNGAAMFFVAVYIHIFRGLFYGSYKAPREILWILGMVIYLLMMATAFMGYLLPWGQMSFWGATVITNFFSAIPLVGEAVVEWLRGGFAVDNPTLNRFFSLHYLLPFMIAGVVMLHIWSLHVSGSNNPAGVEPKTPKDTLPFHPFFTMKDGFAIVCFMILFAVLVFYAPNYLGEADNYIKANPLSTPEHIVPEWYFLPFYAILRAVPSKLGGVLAMFGSIAVLFVVPWLDWSRVKSGRYRPMFKQFFFIFLVVSIGLGYLGAKPADGGYLVASRILTIYYFAHFLIILPLLSIFENSRPVPESIEAAIAKKVKGKTGLFALIAAGGLALMLSAGTPVKAAGEEHATPKQDWSFKGVFGQYDRGALQRGFLVYKEVCAACHSMSLLSIRNLGEPGGPEFTKPQVKSIAAEFTVKDGPNDDGEMFERPGKPSDRFPAPFANENAARAASGGAFPPDLSVIAKARKGGPDYLYSLLTSYTEAPKDVKMNDGMSYNTAFQGNQIAMPNPLSEDAVEYPDGTKASVGNMARDVSHFLMWAAEPKLEARKKMGFQVILYLMVLAGLMYFVTRRVWSGIEH